MRFNQAECSNGLSHATLTIFPYCAGLHVAEFPASVEGRNFVSFGFAFSSMNLTYGLNLTQSRAHLPAHSGVGGRGLTCVWKQSAQGHKRHPWSFASNPRMDYRSLRFTHLTTQFLMQGVKRLKVKVFPIWLAMIGPPPFKRRGQLPRSTLLQGPFERETKDQTCLKGQNSHWPERSGTS